jgi:hypothetical protein
MVIFFNVEKAREHLLREGFVYTLRRRRREGLDRARVGSYKNFTDLGEVKIKLIKKISSPEELQPFVLLAGFENLDEWLRHAVEGADHLYRVELVRPTAHIRG